MRLRKPNEDKEWERERLHFALVVASSELHRGMSIYIYWLARVHIRMYEAPKERAGQSALTDARDRQGRKRFIKNFIDEDLHQMARNKYTYWPKKTTLTILILSLSSWLVVQDFFAPLDSA